LSSDRIQRLEQLDGWIWSQIDEQWNIGFAHLKKYIEKYEDSLVTQKYKTTDEYKLGD
jgi:hypothetical protein